MPPAWALPGDLERLLDRDESVWLLRAGGADVWEASPFYLRVKPSEGAVVGLDLRLRGGGTGDATWACIRTFADADRARALRDKWASKRPVDGQLGPGVRLLPTGRSVLFIFPNDPLLEQMKRVAEMSKLKRVLSGLPQLDALVSGHRSGLFPIRYKPERRFVARLEVRLRTESSRARPREMFVRLFGDRRGERLIEAMTRLRSHGPFVPKPLGALMGGRLAVEEALVGDDLLKDLLAGRGDPHAFADVLRGLHAVPASEGPAHSPEADLASSWRALRLLTGFAPELQPAALRLATRLGQALPHEPIQMQIHGDLHLNQVLVTPEGYQLVDLERAGAGDPLRDLGDLLGHLDLLAAIGPDGSERLADFAAGLEAAYLAPLSARRRQSLVFYRSCALLQQALLALRTQRTGWRAVAETALELTELRLSKSRRWRPARSGPPGDADWEVLYPRLRRRWSGYAEAPDGARLYGVYDHATGRFEPVEPSADPALPALRSWLARGVLVAYRTERRAAVRVVEGTDTAYHKLLPPKRARRLHDHLEQVRDALSRAPEGSCAAALPDAYAADDGMLVFREMSGSCLHDLLMSGSPHARKALSSTGVALARWHETPVRGVDLRGTTQGRLEDWAALVAGHRPELWPRYADALWLIERDGHLFPGAARSLVHGDLHDRNVFVDGSNVGLIDLDLAHVGPAAEDVGNLAAHVVLRALQRGAGLGAGRDQARAFVDAYRRAGGRAVPADVRAATARTLFRLACLYRFRREWQYLTPALLDETVRVLSSEPTTSEQEGPNARVKAMGGPRRGRRGVAPDRVPAPHQRDPDGA